MMGNDSDGGLTMWTTQAASKDYYTVSGIILLFSAILGTSGNGLVVTVIGRKGVPPTVTPVFIANLSGAHFLLCVVTMLPQSVCLMLGAQWKFGQSFCKAVLFIDSVMSSAAILTLSAIAIDRYYSVVYPLERKLSLFKGAMMVAYTWTHAVLISLPKLFVAGVSPVTSCVEQWPSRQQAQIYLVIYMSLTIFAPLLLTCVAYYLVWRGFRSSHRRVNIKGSSGPRRNKPGSANMAQAAVRERRLMHTLLLMVTCFVALWAARVVSLFMRFFSTAALSEYFVLTAFWISKIEPVVDPIIYGYLNKHFRKHLRELIRVCSIHCETEIGLDEIITSDDGEMDNGRSPVVTPQPLPADEILDTPDPEEAALRSHCRRVSLVSNVYTGPGYTFSFAAGAVGMQTTVESARTLPSGPTGSSDRYRKKSRFTKRLMHSKKVNPEAGTSVKIPTIHIEDTQHGEVLFRVNLADHLPFKSHANDLAANTTTAWPADTAVSSYTSTSYPSRLPPLGKPLSKILPPFPLPVPATLSQLNTHTAPPTPKTGTKRKRRKILNKRIEERRHKLQDNTAL